MQLMCFFYQVLVIVTVNVCKIFGIGSLAVYAVENDVVLYWVFDVLHFKLSFTDVLTSSSNIIARSMTAARLVSLFKMALCSLFFSLWQFKQFGNGKIARVLPNSDQIVAENK